MVLAASALMLAAPAVRGATVSFSVASSCAAGCGAAGMAAGDPVLGIIDISTDGFSPSGAITRADVAGFSITFGPTSHGVVMPEAPAFDLSATWGAGVNAISGLSFTAVNAPGLTAPGPFLTFGAGGNLASLTGICDDVDCATTRFQGTPATLDPFTFKPATPPAPVPLPPAGALAAAGALALAAAARFRRERRSRAA